MKLTRTFSVLAAILLVAVALAACGGGGSTGSTKSGTSTGSTSSSSGTPRHGGTMTMAFQSDPDTFDPQVCYDATCWDNMEMLFNRLYDYEGATTNLIAQAASAMPKVSSNGLVYTIPVRSGMTFANGKPVTADDVVYTFSRICNPATKSPVVSFWDPVKGCQAFAKHPVGTVPGLKAVNSHTVQITLTQPDASFKYVLAMPQASIIPTGTGPQQAKHPLGSGPYEFVSFSPGNSIILKRNPHYWDKTLPYTNGVTENLSVSPQTQLLELEKGQIDLMGDPLPNSSYLSVVNDKALQPQVVHRVSLSTYYLTMNVKMKPFNNPLVRQAVSYAIDRKMLLKDVNGQGEPANAFIPRGVSGFTSDQLTHQQDVAKAKQLLKQAGYPNGFTTTMYSWNTEPWTNLDPTIQQQLGQIGIKLKVDPIQESTFFTLAATPNKAPMTLTFWVADYPEASDFFNALLSCAGANGGGQNYSFYCNKQVDGLVNKALADPANSQQYYTQAAQKMLGDNPIVPLYYGQVTEVRGARVQGFFANPIWDLMIDHYWLSKGGSGTSTSSSGL